MYEYGEDLSEVERWEFLEIVNYEIDCLICLVNDVLDLSCLEFCMIYYLNVVDVV